MRKLLNTLYVTTPEAWLARDGECVVVKIGGEEKLKVPLINLENIISFSYAGASPALMHACAKHGIGLSFLSENGYFLARSVGKTNGNVLVRRAQYRMADNKEISLKLASSIISAKIANSRKVLERFLRDYPESPNCARVREASNILNLSKREALAATNMDVLRGIEGNASRMYFSVFNSLILRGGFVFDGRTRRPPKDNVNALLSFAYTLLASDIQSALESIGIDSYVGFFHTDRPGRASLALDMMEEFRGYLADRFVLSLINKNMISADDFIDNGGGGVILKPEARKNFLSTWQKRKHEEIVHPFLGEKVSVGLLVYVQAMMFSKYLRGELDGYPVFLI